MSTVRIKGSKVVSLEEYNTLGLSDKADHELECPCSGCKATLVGVKEDFLEAVQYFETNENSRKHKKNCSFIEHEEKFKTIRKTLRNGETLLINTMLMESPPTFKDSHVTFDLGRWMTDHKGHHTSVIITDPEFLSTVTTYLKNNKDIYDLKNCFFSNGQQVASCETKAKREMIKNIIETKKEESLEKKRSETHSPQRDFF